MPSDCGPFSDLVRAYRAAAHLTQEELAERSGLSVHGIGMLERGVRRAPRAITVELLADALRLDAKQRAMLVAAARERTAPRPMLPAEPRSGLPPDPDPHFVGRQNELSELRRALRRAGRVAVHGLGGVGKTQLVVQHLHRHRAEYTDGVFWLRAGAKSSVRGDLAGLAWHLELPERELPNQERQVAAVLRWLRDHSRWLLVLDDVEPVTLEAVDHWLPPGLPGHLLATSRTPMWSVRMGLGPLPLGTATCFLLQRTGQDDADAAGAVAGVLGQLPLALAQAAAYIEATGRDLAGYRNLLRTRLLELMAEARPDDYPRTVATTWQVSFERLEAERPAAAALLRLCAFLAPHDIPVEVLQAGAGQLPGELRDTLADDLALDRTIAALGRYSLAGRSGDRLQVHPLVQVVVRDAMGPGLRGQWLLRAVRLLHATFPDEPEVHPEHWPACARLLPHVELVASLADGLFGEPLGEVLQRAGAYAWARSQLGLARTLLERALAIRERDLGPNDPVTAWTLNYLAEVLHYQGEVSAARSLLERALTIRERALGGDHQATAESHNDLALLLVGEGDLAGARSLLKRALAAMERTVGLDHHHTVTVLSNLGLVLHKQGDLATSRLLLERAVAIGERRYGSDHLIVGRSLRNLSMTLLAQGERAAADLTFKRALAIHQRVLGHDHPDTARTLHRRAVGLREDGKLAAAATLFQRAIAIYELAVPTENPMFVESRRALDELRRAQRSRTHTRHSPTSKSTQPPTL